MPKPPGPIRVGDYVLTPPNVGVDPRSAHTGRVVRIIGRPGYEPELVIWIDSARKRISLFPEEITYLSYDEASFE